MLELLLVNRVVKVVDELDVRFVDRNSGRSFTSAWNNKKY